MCFISVVMQSTLNQPPNDLKNQLEDAVTRHAFEELMRKAKEYDRITKQPNCENDEKRKALKKIADELGVEIAFP